MGLYTGPWRTSICLGATAMIGGLFAGLAFLPGASSGFRLAVIMAGVLWSAFFVAALGREIARHWRDLDVED